MTASLPSINRQWQLRRRPVSQAGAEDLHLVDTPLAPLAQGQVRVRNIYLSLDPTLRLWMSDREQYLPPVALGSVMRGSTAGVVVESRSERMPVGTRVLAGLAGWEEYSVLAADQVRKLPAGPDVPMSASMSVLGNTGLTAWFGMMEIGQPRPGETVVVSAAAGAVGSVAGQIARLKGARVVGIAGGPDKCRWLTGALGFDAAIDYRNEDVGAALDRLCPSGIDVAFENVGGDIMGAVLARMNTFGRVALCGMISSYNQEGPIPYPGDLSLVLMRRLRIQGFLVMDYLRRSREALAELTPWVCSGQLQWKVHVVPGLENATTALQMLFDGTHDGKLLLRIAPEDG